VDTWVSPRFRGPAFRGNSILSALSADVLGDVLSRPVAGVLHRNRSIGCVYTSKERRRGSGELETKIQGATLGLGHVTITTQHVPRPFPMSQGKSGCLRSAETGLFLRTKRHAKKTEGCEMNMEGAWARRKCGGA
jgi:hypothetical protein